MARVFLSRRMGDVAGRKGGSSPTLFKLLAAVLVTWEYWQLPEAKSSPKPCKLTLL